MGRRCAGQDSGVRRLSGRNAIHANERMENASAERQAGARDAHDARNARRVHARARAYSPAMGLARGANDPYPFLRKIETMRPTCDGVPVSARLSAETGTHSGVTEALRGAKACPYPFLRMPMGQAVPVSAAHCARLAGESEPVSADRRLPPRTRFCAAAPQKWVRSACSPGRQAFG